MRIAGRATIGSRSDIGDDFHASGGDLIGAPLEARAAILKEAEIFGARVIDSSVEGFALEATGDSEKLDEFINQLEALVTAPMEDISALTEAEYPERILAGEYTNHRQDEYAMNVLKRSPYLKPQSLWCRVYNLIKLKLLKN